MNDADEVFQFGEPGPGSPFAELLCQVARTERWNFALLETAAKNVGITTMNMRKMGDGTYLPDTWSQTQRFLRQLGVTSPELLAEFNAGYVAANYQRGLARAGVHRPEPVPAPPNMNALIPPMAEPPAPTEETGAPGPAQTDPLSDPAVLQFNDRLIQQISKSFTLLQHRPAAPKLLADPDGFNLKPDPLTAQTIPDLERLLREFWNWAGCPSTRDLARRSGHAFSHATISKLIYNKAAKPPLKLDYVRGIIRGCGADQDEERLWVTAWRKLSRLQAAHAEPLRGTP